jgi:hypothetical protein
MSLVTIQSDSVKCIKQNLIQILSYYALVDTDLAQKNSIKYYTHSESDEDNITKFDHLSNNNLIGIVCRLNPIQATIILRIFQALYDNNYWFFERENLAFCMDLPKSEITNIIDSIQFTQILEQHFELEFDEDNNVENIYGSTYISSNLPEPSILYGSYNNQQYLTIEELIKKFN